MKFYEEALRFDVFCVEAYEKLIKKHMYTPEEGIESIDLIENLKNVLEQRLVERMIIEKQCDSDTASVVRCLYEQEVHQVRSYLNEVVNDLCLVYETNSCESSDVYSWVTK